MNSKTREGLESDETDAGHKKSGALTKEQRDTLMDILPSMERVVHLDLKGAAPKVSYFEELLPLFRTLGATGLLIGIYNY